MNVAFEMVDADQRQRCAERECLGKSDADQQSSCESGTLGDGNGVKIRIGDPSPL